MPAHQVAAGPQARHPRAVLPDARLPHAAQHPEPGRQRGTPEGADEVRLLRPAGERDQNQRKCEFAITFLCLLLFLVFFFFEFFTGWG